MPLSFSVSVHADRFRIFQVLTIAEYMEAWISIPAQPAHVPVHVACDPHGFRILYFDEMRVPTMLTALYRTYRNSKMTFLWSRTSDTQSATSIVKVRLQGDFARTTLHLTHDGLCTDEDRVWHKTFWEISLNRLCGLFQAPAPVRDQSMNSRRRKELIAEL